MRILFSFIAFASVLVGCDKKNNVPKDTLLISGEIKDFDQGVMYAKTIGEDGNLQIMDSVVFRGNPKYNMQFTLKEPQVVYLSIDKGTSSTENDYILFFATPGEMKVNSNLTYFFRDAIIEGSEPQKVYEKYLESKKYLISQNNDLIKEYTTAMQLNQNTKADSIEQKIKRSNTRLYLNAVNFAIKNKNSIVSPYIALTEVALVSNKFLDSIYNGLDTDVKSSLYGKKLKEYTQSIEK